MDLSEKILTHRLRGFSEIENTFAALRKACTSGVKYLELDIRVSKDGNPYVYHDPNTGQDVGAKVQICETDSTELNKLRYANGEGLLTLEQTLEYFSTHGGAYQKLAIDIKDYGYEDILLQMVESHGLTDKIVWVSWMPHSLIRFHELGSKIPLILSHVNISKYAIFGDVISLLFSKMLIKRSSNVVFGGQRINVPLGKYSQGYLHALVGTRLPVKLRNILQENGGGICVHSSNLCARLFSYCRKSGLELWVFGLPTAVEYLEALSNPSIDVAFCETTKEVIDGLKMHNNKQR